MTDGEELDVDAGAGSLVGGTGPGVAGGDARFWGGGVIAVGDAGIGEGALAASKDVDGNVD